MYRGMSTAKLYTDIPQQTTARQAHETTQQWGENLQVRLPTLSVTYR